MEYSLHVGATPLFLAALAGHLVVVQVLVRATAQVDACPQHVSLDVSSSKNMLGILSPFLQKGTLWRAHFCDFLDTLYF